MYLKSPKVLSRANSASRLAAVSDSTSWSSLSPPVDLCRCSGTSGKTPAYLILFAHSRSRDQQHPVPCPMQFPACKTAVAGSDCSSSEGHRSICALSLARAPALARVPRQTLPWTGTRFWPSSSAPAAVAEVPASSVPVRSSAIYRRCTRTCSSRRRVDAPWGRRAEDRRRRSEEYTREMK